MIAFFALKISCIILNDIDKNIVLLLDKYESYQDHALDSVTHILNRLCLHSRSGTYPWTNKYGGSIFHLFSP